MGLIDELRDDHKKIISMMDDIGTHRHDLKEVAIVLNEYRSFFIEHLQKEDEKICGALSKIEDADYSIGQARGLMGIQLKDITAFIVDFIEKYSHYHLNSDGLKAEFKEDFERLQELVKERIAIEENTFFPLYTRLVTKQ
jgi:hypothetical protein